MNETTKFAVQMCHQLVRFGTQYLDILEWGFSVVNISSKKLPSEQCWGCSNYWIYLLLAFYLLNKSIITICSWNLVNISTICQSECFECTFMTTNWFHPISLNSFIDIKNFICYFRILMMFFPKSREYLTKYSAYNR